MKCPFSFGCIQRDQCAKARTCIWGQEPPEEPKRKPYDPQAPLVPDPAALRDPGDGMTRPITRKVGSGRLVAKDGKIAPERWGLDDDPPSVGRALLVPWLWEAIKRSFRFFVRKK